MAEENGLPVVNEITKMIRHLPRQWNKINKALKRWDVNTLSQMLGAFSDEVQNMASEWEKHRGTIDDYILDKQQVIMSDSYPQEVERCLREVGIPLRGEFPDFQFPPFKLAFALEESAVRLTLGRRRERCTILRPEDLVEWVRSRYQKVVGRKFNAARFRRELFEAYKMVNQLNYRQESTLWGRAVSLKEIYRLLTLRVESKSDYPIALFEYDLARLGEEYENSHNGHSFELGFSRSQHNSLLITDSQGRESRISSLTIHQKGDD